jgi:ATP-binding cassette subfamily B protein
VSEPFLRPPGGPDAPFPSTALAFVLHYLRGRGFAYSGLFSLIVGAALCAVAVQIGVRLMVDAMAGVGVERDWVWIAFAMFCALVGIESALWRFAGWLGSRTIAKSMADLRLDLFAHLSGHSTRFFADQLAGALGNRITAAGTAFERLMIAITWSIAPPTTDFVGAVIVFCFVDWRMAVALILFVSIVVAGLALFGAQGRPLHRGHAEEASRTTGEIVDGVANIWVVKAFSARAREHRRLAARFGAESEAQVRSWRHLEKIRIVHDVALWLMAGSMLGWAIHSWSLGRITPGEVVMVSALTFRILHGSRDLALALIGTIQQFSTIGETLRVIAHPHAVADRTDAKPFVPRGGAIALENIAFTHPGGRRVFENFRLRVPAGQKVGLVGPSGAGKSTLLALLQRLDDVQGGRILVDGQAIDSVSQDSLRAAIAVVPQDISLFHRSVLDNIRYGRPEASDEEVMAAARAAYCDEFVRALPKGYATIVGERGMKLSGGQRQRLGIARAILKDAPILILDEATSALDSESEIAVQKALAVLMRGRTVLAVAHRLSTLSALDRIIVLVDGRIVEDGSPAELRRRGGAFDTLWRLQAEGFVFDDAA